MPTFTLQLYRLDDPGNFVQTPPPQFGNNGFVFGSITTGVNPQPITVELFDDDGTFDFGDGSPGTIQSAMDANGNPVSSLVGGNIEQNQIGTEQMVFEDASGIQISFIKVTIGGIDYVWIVDSPGTPLMANTPYTEMTTNFIVNTPWESNATIPCFTAGTLIKTDQGNVAIEELAVGDKVETRNNGLQPIRWIGKKALGEADLVANPKLQPIRIKSGALGAGLPAQNLMVSRQHRMLSTSNVAQEYFGVSDVLISAIQLTKLRGVRIAKGVKSVTYFSG